MAVGPVTLNGVIPRSQDIGTIKHQEDQKPLVEQQNIQTTMKTQGERQVKQVNHKDDASEHKKKYDAKEKGNGEYQGRKGKKKKPEAKEVKQDIAPSRFGGFDMKI